VKFSRIAVPLLISTLGVTAVLAQDLPDVGMMELFAKYESRKTQDPVDALDIADQILVSVQDADLRLAFARTALDAEQPQRALSYIAPVLDSFDVLDPRATQVLDLAALAYAALGDEMGALQASLGAFNAAAQRLGTQNPVLSARLDVLEPQVERLMPHLMQTLRDLRDNLDVVVDPDATVRATDPTAVKVWFGTNRLATGSQDPAQMFGTDRGDLTVGELTVTIPPNHMAGMIERPEGWFFTEHLDPDKHVVLSSIQDLTLEAFAQGCCEKDDKLLFIHGYNVTFHDGALRAGQLAFDLEFPGQALYYSWPSQGSLYGYLSDSNGVLATRPALETYLEIATRGQGTLHIIAHSMGNRYAIEALETFFLKFPDRRVGQLILAAPDVDRAELATRFDALKSHADGITLYASKYDRALQVSRHVNGGYRAGDANGDLIQLAGLDTVDASLIETDSLGHSYFGDAPALLGDILGLVRLGWEPLERCGIKPGAGKTVWDVQPDGCPVEQVRTAGDLIRLYPDAPLSEAQSRLEDASGEQEEFWLGVMAVIQDRTRQ